MTKEDVLLEFETAALNPGAKYSGNEYEEYVLKRAKRLIVTDRTVVIEALKYWLQLRDDSGTMIAVDLIGILVIPELKRDLEELKAEIENGKVFFPYYSEPVKKALKAID